MLIISRFIIIVGIKDIDKEVEERMKKHLTRMQWLHTIRTNDRDKQSASINGLIASQCCKQFTLGSEASERDAMCGTFTPILISKEEQVNKFKANRVVKVNLTVKHLVITKGTTTTDHTIIHLNNNINTMTTPSSSSWTKVILYA